ncbi:MAG: putative enoyl-CoA hydratase echA12 [Hydrocarboniphaga sp.]|uniref:enoyl-CoA hydratase/isomerase family protein n=1 Tax=Hydrocarboniphaga sp. TaxID=2033016 RepID=UPI002626FB43|nr:enoyl-CoA hydratase/isomerase family protein [Hydrocarboniphaga sp.]MDB5969989.1 putative enoyl-CoA hydratase echA12 [Hydrocarboniphaga sp.]
MSNEVSRYRCLLVESRGAVDWVTLNRPQQLNALDAELTSELLDYFQRLYFDHAVRIVVLRGAGKAFCAGLDLKEAGSTVKPSPAEALRKQRSISEIVMRMRRAPQPIVSLIQGAACGGGFALALASDIRIAGESARMNAAFIRIGLSACDIGVSYFLPRLVGVSLASELMLTGRFIDAARALRSGLVSEVVPDKELERATQGYVDDMLATAPLGLRLTKEGLNQSVDAGSLESVIAMEDRQQCLCGQSDDLREAIDAFIAKRPPVYQDS